jgi:predicted PurR-regulated permease PerM
LQPENATMSRTATVVSALIAAAVFIWLAFDLLLLVFAGVLLAIFLRTLAIWISGLTRLKVGWSLTIVLLLLLGGAALTSVLFAPRLAEETQQLTEKLPEAVTQLTDWLRGYSWGRWLLNEMPDGPAGEGSGQVVERATGAASKLFHGIVAFAIVLFVGIYLAAEPEPYQRGLLRLFPIARRQRAGEVMFATGYTLRWWLFGQILAMLIVGLTMGIGLSIIGVPLAFALGVLAGLLEFIPTLGPPIAVVPAILLALVDDPQKALYVLILYSIVQTLEGYLLTPLVQRSAVSLPPALTIAAQVFMAWNAGALGLLVAVPLLAVVKVAVQMFYVEDALGDELELPAEKSAGGELAEAGILKDLE